ncbi:hypothetical protein [Limnoglobus roseus]|uniref:hypothetical protein n=1 Tax=Limnoglobus roseus TaxID=2598579 RepID=UPI0011EAB264|nr:hypothetical protein [Limnoglobus roseus]
MSQLYVERPPGLDTQLADAFVAVATAMRECARLVASVYYLWEREGEYRRLAACVADAATAARTAYLAVDLRLRRAGGPNAMLDVLNDVLTVHSRAPLNPPATPDGLNAVLTNLYMKRADTFARVDGRGCIDRMLDQLARVPPPTNNTPAAAEPYPAASAPLPQAKPGDGEKAQPPTPFHPLTSWGEIFAALNAPHGRPVLKNDEPTRDKIRKLNTKHDGPIVFPRRKGKQPSVGEAALMAWWDAIREHFDARNAEKQAKAMDARLTVADTHNFGASETVVPGVSGSVKRTRKKKDDKGKEGKR